MHMYDIESLSIPVATKNNIWLTVIVYMHIFYWIVLAEVLQKNWGDDHNYLSLFKINVLILPE